MEEDDKVPPGLKMPSDHALHAVFIRSATLAEAKVHVFLRETLDHGPSLSNFMIPLLDPKFDDLMSSLGKIALKHPKPVIYSIMSWRRGHNENVSVDILKHHASQSPLWTRAARVQEPSTLLNERKSLTSIYIMRRALIAVLSKDALGDAMGLFLGGNEVWSVQETGREASYPCHGSFLGELEPVAHGRVAKDFDTKYEHLVKGLRHVQLRVPPPEAFEEGAEFLESLAKSFANAHGMRRQAEQEEPTVKAVLAKRARTDVAQDENLLSRMERDVLQEWETKREKLTVLEMGVVTYDQDVRSTPHIKREIAHLCPAASSNSVDPARSMTQPIYGSSMPPPATTAWPMSNPPSAYFYQPETLGNEFSVFTDFLETLDEGSFFTTSPAVSPSLMPTLTFSQATPYISNLASATDSHNTIRAYHWRRLIPFTAGASDANSRKAPILPWLRSIDGLNTPT
ncbi:hypothetical protein EDD22DRAFT_1008332 [Suillus occidentalis]|nr:hypothetical protein EDD22DRAFT_1009818 [Suillus occidentalis]KAG1739786.1 hypothetical protein EDD22DRAFT_1008332 [Suillus occidentalis]